MWAPTIGAPPGLGSSGGLDSLTGATAPHLATEIDRVKGLAGARTVELVGHSHHSGHLTVFVSPRAVNLVSEALGGAHSRPPRCVPADGGVGVLAPVPPR